MSKMIIVLLAIISTVVAEINTTTWNPDAWNDQDLRYLCVNENQQAFLVTVKDRKNMALYAVDTKDKKNIKILGKCTLTKRLGKSAFHWEMGCCMLYNDGYVYIVPAGSYQTSVLIFNVQQADNLHFVKEIPLFHQRNFIHYVEIPQSMGTHNNRLFVQTMRGISIIDISNNKESAIVQEVDGVEVLAAEGNSICYALKNDSLVFFHEDINTPIPNLDYINSDLNNKVSYRVSSCAGQFSSKSLFLLEKQVDNEVSFHLQLLHLNKKNLAHNRMDYQSWEWQKVQNAASDFPYVALQHKEKVSLYELSLEKKPQLLADLKLKHVNCFTLHNKHLYACTANGLVIVSGW